MSTAVTAIIVNYNGGADLVDCVRSVTTQKRVNAEIIVVDNASNDESLEAARSAFPEIIVVQNQVNRGFAGGANDGARVAAGDALLFLNPDIVLTEGSLEVIAKALSGATGVVGPRLVVGS